MLKVDITKRQGGLVFSIYNFFIHYKTAQGRKSGDKNITWVLTIKHFTIWLPKRKVVNMILEIFRQNQILFKYSFNSKAAKRPFRYYVNRISTFYYPTYYVSTMYLCTDGKQKDSFSQPHLDSMLTTICKPIYCLFAWKKYVCLKRFTFSESVSFKSHNLDPYQKLNVTSKENWKKKSNGSKEDSFNDKRYLTYFISLGEKSDMCKLLTIFVEIFVIFFLTLPVCF